MASFWLPRQKYILFCLCLSVEKLISCQADLSDRRVVSPKAGAELAASLGLQYFESSAKDQTGVEVRILKSPSQFSAFYFDIFWPSADIEKLNCPPGTFLLLSKRVAQTSQGASSRDGRNCLRSYLIIFDHIWSYLIIFDHIWSYLIIFEEKWQGGSYVSTHPPFRWLALVIGHQ